MTQIQDLFEAHLTVRELDRAIQFYRDVLGLRLANVFPERQAAFFWIGSEGNAMLGLWAGGYGPQRMTLHIAFRTGVEAVLDSPRALRAAGITPLDFDGRPATEPVVLAWMPAVSVYFADPDGNQLEYIAMLPEPARPELGVIRWSLWEQTSS